MYNYAKRNVLKIQKKKHILIEKANVMKTRDFISFKLFMFAFVKGKMRSTFYQAEHFNEEKGEKWRS